MYDNYVCTYVYMYMYVCIYVCMLKVGRVKRENGGALVDAYFTALLVRHT